MPSHDAPLDRRSFLAAAALTAGTVVLPGGMLPTRASAPQVTVGLLTGTFRVVNRGSGKVLDVADRSTADGARVIQWPWPGGRGGRLDERGRQDRAAAGRRFRPPGMGRHRPLNPRPPRPAVPRLARA
ncbi:RICIN domain-containing protein [Streptomyces sp. NPDC058718]|uniref:RICIN domain-containing protein n=1 Tax=Streptomyces sp. NPDC058718 TaxID=3346610 RepID=UPI003692D099